MSTPFFLALYARCLHAIEQYFLPLLLLVITDWHTEQLLIMILFVTNKDKIVTFTSDRINQKVLEKERQSINDYRRTKITSR